MKIFSVSTHILPFWRTYVLLITPFLASLIFLNPEDAKAMKVAYILIIMAIYWVTEALPVAVTSLIPVAALPLMGIMSAVSSI